MVHPVEATEDAAESVLLRLQLLLSREDLSIQLELFVFLWVYILHLQRLLQHCYRI